MGCSPTRSWPRGSWTAWSTAPTTCSCRARATAPTSARAPTRPTRHKEVAQARTAPVGVSDSLIDPLMNSLIVHTLLVPHLVAGVARVRKDRADRGFAPRHPQPVGVAGAVVARRRGAVLGGRPLGAGQVAAAVQEHGEDLHDDRGGH